MTDFDRSMSSLSEATLSLGDTLDDICAMLEQREQYGITASLEHAYFERLETLIADIGFQIRACKVARTAIRAYIIEHRPSAP